MKPFRHLFLLTLFCLSALYSCHGRKAGNHTSLPGPKDYPALGYVQATVIRYELDGCSWLLQLENGKKLVPSALPAREFQADGTKIWLRYTLKKGAVGICMAGDVVDVTAIEKRD